MEPYFSMADDHGYRVHVLTVENWHGSKNIHNVPAITIRKMDARFEHRLGAPNSTNFPARIRALDFVEQSPIHHPEGTVGTHTALVVGALLKKYPRNEELHWAGLFHDMGKLEATEYNEVKGTWTAYGHENFSVLHWNEFVEESYDMRRGFIPGENPIRIGKVEWIIKNHMRYKQLDTMRQTKVDELKDNGWFEDLEKLGEADNMKLLFETTTHDERVELINMYDNWLTGIELNCETH